VDEADDVASYVERYIRAGFHTPVEIEQIVGRDVFGGKLAAGMLRAMIAQAVHQHEVEEATWPAKTDCDRLDAVFTTLEDQGIIALQNAGNTMSEGLSDVFSTYHEAGGAASGYDGYCFYHGQDLENVVEGGYLHLAFGATDDDPTRGGPGRAPHQERARGRRVLGRLERVDQTADPRDRSPVATTPPSLTDRSIADLTLRHGFLELGHTLLRYLCGVQVEEREVLECAQFLQSDV
jgi:hypothetical protein